MTTRWAPDVVRAGTQRLAAAGLEHARQEAEWLLGHLLGTRPLDVYLEERAIPEPTTERFFAQIASRASGMPLQYLLGEAEFYGERFLVAPGVFIPRPETEVIVERALDVLRLLAQQLARPLRVLEVGTGSGCIAITLARGLPTCVVVGVELSWNALRVARRNVERAGLSSRVQLVQGCWLEAIRGRVEGLIANPPYVPSGQVDALPRDVRQEPRLSLDGGDDGLRDLLQIIEKTPRVLAPGGVLVLECGEPQVERLLGVCRAARWVASAIRVDDLANRPRGVLVMRRTI